MYKRVGMKRPQSGNEPPRFKKPVGLIDPCGSDYLRSSAYMLSNGGQQCIEAGVTDGIRAVLNRMNALRGRETLKGLNKRERQATRLSGSPRSVVVDQTSPYLLGNLA